MSTELIGIASGLVGCISIFPQIYKSYKTRSSKDISTGTILLTYLAQSLGIVYGVLINHYAVYISNSVGLVLFITLHVVKYHNESNHEELLSI